MPFSSTGRRRLVAGAQQIAALVHRGVPWTCVLPRPRLRISESTLVSMDLDRATALAALAKRARPGMADTSARNGRRLERSMPDEISPNTPERVGGGGVRPSGGHGQ